MSFAVRPRAFMVLGLLVWALLASTTTAQDGTQAEATQSGDSTATPDSESKLPWDLLHRRYNTWNGITGGIAVVDATSGEPGAVRIQLGLDGYSGSDYLYDGDEIDFRSQTLSVSVTATEFLELFATLSNRATLQFEPEGRALNSFGDYTFGVKFGGHVARTLSVGGDLRAVLGGEVGGSGQAWDSTSVGLRAALTVDLQELEKPLPVVGRLNVGYMFDNSANLVSDVEDRRYKDLADPAPKADETQHLVDRFERLAFNVNRLDKLTIGVGVEVPLALAKGLFLHPIVEWQFGIPVNRQGYDCPYFKEDAESGSPSTENDSCFERHPSAAPMNLLLGVRVVPPVRGLSILLGADIGLSGTDRFVRELAPNLPYRVLVAIGYDYDARPVPEKIVEVKEPAPPPLAAPAAVPAGRVQGVVSTTEGQAIASAIVSFPELALTSLSTGADGTFVTEAFAPGTVSIQVTHPDYENGACPATVPEAGGDVAVRCVLVPKPALGGIVGRVSDAWGNPVANARVALTTTGSTGLLVTTNPSGVFEAPALAPGDYALRIEALGYFSRQATVQVGARATGRIELSLTRKPSRPSIALRADSGVDAPALAWPGETVELTNAGELAVAELAELLMARPDLSVRIQGYGTPLVSQQRAEVVKQRLIALGIAEHRIEALGGGKNAVRIQLRP